MRLFWIFQRKAKDELTHKEDKASEVGEDKDLRMWPQAKDRGSHHKPEEARNRFYLSLPKECGPADALISAE